MHELGLAKAGKTDEGYAQELLEQGYFIQKTLPPGKHEVHLLARKNGEDYRIKLLAKRDYFGNEHLRIFLNNEVKIANKAKGFAHLAQLHTFMYTKHYAVFVYELYDSGTIASYFEDQEFNLLQVIVLLKDMFLALEELKGLGFIHMNLNEQNIFVAGNTIRLGGFEHCIEIGAPRPTYNYHLYLLDSMKSVVQSIPPEVVLNKQPGLKTCMYSLGALLHKLIYKKPHYEASTLLDLKNQVLMKAKLKLMNDLPQDMNNLLRRLLEYDCDSRLSMFELKQYLAHLLTYCKYFEEEIRMSVFLKRTIHAFRNLNMRELKQLNSDPQPTTGNQNNTSMGQNTEKADKSIDSTRILKIKTKTDENRESARGRVAGGRNQDSSKNLPYIGSFLTQKRPAKIRLVGLYGLSKPCSDKPSAESRLQTQPAEKPEYKIPTTGLKFGALLKATDHVRNKSYQGERKREKLNYSMMSRSIIGERNVISSGIPIRTTEGSLSSLVHPSTADDQSKPSFFIRGNFHKRGLSTHAVGRDNEITISMFRKPDEPGDSTIKLA